MISGLPILALMKSAMTHATERQKTYTNNVTNANTPKFKAKEVEEFNLKRSLKGQRRVAAFRTSDMHLEGTVPRSGFKIFKDPIAAEMSPDGNNVNLTEQSLKLSETNNDYQLVTGVYRKISGILKATIGEK